MKIAYLGGKHVGILGALTVLALGHKISGVVSYSEDLTGVLRDFGLTCYRSIRDNAFQDALKNSDLLLCVHGREIVPSSMLQLPQKGGINLHPYLYRYPGANPIQRALQESNFRASVGAHRMTSQVDAGEVLCEEFTEAEGANTVEEVYAKLYPLYIQVIILTLSKIQVL
ncbi:MAG: hypothetical protein A3C35_02500 [Omnitrophica bacterium RIFCSPHIGHO2_02_FULL_46_11]|nr:MAG: hypothetical protein A3C35_02500 [Omnitrophica bacterium RIFCSPHIGHO2_02_FULL_46_11]OGW85584.1 MAG: hypothetical protein A3A81_01215 [Omnitrophica bacterium RIFCSPLOWO2_01_FULL_45_10b]